MHMSAYGSMAQQRTLAGDRRKRARGGVTTVVIGSLAKTS